MTSERKNWKIKYKKETKIDDQLNRSMLHEALVYCTHDFCYFYVTFIFIIVRGWELMKHWKEVIQHARNFHIPWYFYIQRIIHLISYKPKKWVFKNNLQQNKHQNIYFSWSATAMLLSTMCSSIDINEN